MNGSKPEIFLIESSRYPPKVVTWAESSGYKKSIRLDSDDQSLILPSSACVTKGDTIRYNTRSAWVICNNGEAQFFPPYIVKEKIVLGDLNLDLLIKEITTQEEYEGYRGLADLHYRGHALRGRSSRLIVRSFHPLCPTVIGYVELTTPLYMNKARALVIDAPFKNDHIEWKQWNITTQKKYINLFVRIARVVVCPEFRGLGISQLLVRYATEFAKKRWQIAGIKPYFLEISADMLKYVPFVEKADMHYVGETQGNLSRVAKDMSYLIKRFGLSAKDTTSFQESCGICDEQISRMKSALRVMGNTGMSCEDLTKKLKNLPKQDILSNYALFHKIVSFPKPHYMQGLNANASRFLEERIATLNPKNRFLHPQITISPIYSSISFNDFSVSYITHVRRTRATHAIQQAFGISPEKIQFDVIRNLSLTVKPGEIILIIGPSGSGKTTILDNLMHYRKIKSANYTSGTVTLPEEARIGTFDPILSNKSLIEVLSGKDIHLGLYLMGIAGLSEAFLYLKRFKELSKGQQYRAMLARLIASKNNVWIADEFCSNLDHITANIVANNTQKIARSLGATVILASPDCSSFIHSLKPDKVLLLSNVGTYSVYSGRDYKKMMNLNAKKGASFPLIKISSENVLKINERRQHSIIQIGHKNYLDDSLFLESKEEIIPVKITKLIHKRFSDLTEEDAKDNGLESLNELQKTLKSINPNIKLNSYVTIIHFEGEFGEVDHGK